MKHPKKFEVPFMFPGVMKAYNFPSPVFAKSMLAVMASVDGKRWEHVSVHGIDPEGKQYVPTWDEMCFIKDQFFEEEQTAIQFHPKKSSYVNLQPFVLHLWRDLTNAFELPHNK